MLTDGQTDGMRVTNIPNPNWLVGGSNTFSWKINDLLWYKLSGFSAFEDNIVV